MHRKWEATRQDMIDDDTDDDTDDDICFDVEHYDCDVALAWGERYVLLIFTISIFIAWSQKYVVVILGGKQLNASTLRQNLTLDVGGGGGGVALLEKG